MRSKETPDHDDGGGGEKFGGGRAARDGDNDGDNNGHSDGGARLRAVGGRTLEGLRPGGATVSARLDGVDSGPPVPVSVISATQVALPAPSQPLAPGGVWQFAATVTGTPAAEAGVVWSVMEGEAGGTITADGRYTAPATPGVYRIVAASVWDPTRSATATVTVAVGGLTVGGTFPDSGGIGVEVR